MDRPAPYLIGLILLFSAPDRLPAELLENFPLDVTATDRTQVRDRKKTGRTKDESFQNSYTVEFRNISSDKPFAKIKLRVFPFFSTHTVKKQIVQLRLGQVQTRENIAVAALATVKVEFDVENFSRQDSVMVHYVPPPGISTSTPTASGSEYEGMVLEIYIDGRRVAQRYSGSSEVRKAYEEMIVKGSLPSENKDPASPFMRQPQLR